MITVLTVWTIMNAVVTVLATLQLYGYSRMKRELRNGQTQ